MQSSTIKEMKELGAPKHIIDELEQAKIIEIYPQNWPIVTWFLEVCDLMRYRSDGACLGLDLNQINNEMQLSNRTSTPMQFKGLRIMSKAAARTMNKVADE